MRGRVVAFAVPLAVVASSVALGCSSTPAPVAAAHPVTPAAPPKDDGKASDGTGGGTGGDAHAAALEQLKTAAIGLRGDKQGSVRVPLPDARNWTRVKFWGVKSLVGFRYGKEHHAIVGAVVTHVEPPGDPTAPGVCHAAFEAWARPMMKAFDVELTYDAPDAFVGKSGHLVEVTSLTAHTATVLSQDTYLVSYAAFPVPEWNNGCLVVGLAVPAREETGRARAVRDRWVKEGLPKLQVTSKSDPPERF